MFFQHFCGQGKKRLNGGVKMNQQPNVIGIGCFAKSNTIYRVFKKVLEDYILSKYEDIYPAGQYTLNDESVTQFFRSVITHGIEKPDQIDRALESIPTTAVITGFFLGLKKQALHLILFFLHSGHQQNKFNVQLEKFARLRKNQLN
jgi:hypothetical protein